ncbi:multidrug transporter [Microbacterium sp.]|uniref:multidrug transporter n=1 Tax=Microbacterium sp. TaxID=51671 RepID=UPI0037C62420
MNDDKATPGGADEMSREEKRHDQLTAAPDATEADAAPRIEVSDHDGTTRVDIAATAAVRPGPGPGMAESSGENDADEAD